MSPLSQTAPIMKIINIMIAMLIHLKRYMTQILSNSCNVFIDNFIWGIYVNYVKFKNHLKKLSEGTRADTDQTQMHKLQ